MPSKAYELLKKNLSDVEEIIEAHQALTGGGKGKPAGGQGVALTRAGVVLLSAAMEAFIEELFKEAVVKLYPKMSPDGQKTLFKQTAERLNNADALKTNLLYFNLGCPWVLSEVRWQKFSNKEFLKSLESLINTRGNITHGGRPNIRLKKLRDWLKMVRKYGLILERVVGNHLSKPRKAVKSPWRSRLGPPLAIAEWLGIRHWSVVGVLDNWPPQVALPCAARLRSDTFR